MPEKTDCPKRHAPITQSFERFLKGVDNEPKNTAHFAEKASSDIANLLKNDRRRRDQRFFGRIFFCVRHSAVKLPQYRRSKKRFLLAGVRLKRGLLVQERGKIYVGASFFNLWTVRGPGVSPCPIWQDEFHERK